jgi:hydrazine synthase alpha subunit-like protein/WD40 repeat protein
MGLALSLSAREGMSRVAFVAAIVSSGVCILVPGSSAIEPGRPSGEVPIVYSRCLRTERTAPVTHTVVVNGSPVKVEKTLGHSDVLDVLPDVSNFFGGFTAPCDLVFRSDSGAERVLYDCASQATDQRACAALDAAVSFDGKTIAFSVFRGPILRRALDLPPKFFHPAAADGKPLRIALPNAYLQSREAQLFLVDVATGKITGLPHSAGVFDSGPAWLSNGRLAFTSTRSGQFSTLVSELQRPASQIFTSDVDGRNVEKASYHALAGEQHPFQLRDGRVALSSWQLFGMLPYRNDNGAPGSFGTLDNFFHVYSQHPDGANPFPLFGQHTTNLGSYPNPYPAHFAAHFATQSSDGRLWVGDYYRGNNSGLGQVVGFPLPPIGQEGIAPDRAAHPHDIYRPVGFTMLTLWASGFDEMAGRMPGSSVQLPTYRDPLALVGKISHPAALPKNALLITWAAGGCSTVTGGYLEMEILTRLERDNPGCDAGIYRTSRIPSRHPSDLVQIVNSREYHEIMARAVVPYSAIHGIEKPATIPRAELAVAGDSGLLPGTPFGILGASSIILRETRPVGGIPFSGTPFAFSLQGTDTVDYKDDELCGIRILAVQPNQTAEYKRYKTTVGERVAILGEFPVRKRDGGEKSLRDSTGAPDTSFKVRFPANTPYLMQGIDCLGRTLNTDQTWQHLRPGELKTCNGCHVHGKEGLPFNKTAAADPNYRAVRLGEGSVPLLAGGSGAAVQVVTRPGYGLQFEYERDVFPILQRRCAACHSGTEAAAGLVLDLPGTGTGSTYDRLVQDRGQRFVPAGRRYPHPIRKPQLTKYVRALNARGSLLYWKAINQRTDGRTDTTYTRASGPGWEDVDFGPSHPTSIILEELAALSRWLDTGAAAQAGFLADTTPPTLHLAAGVSGQAVTTLYVGTADVVSGIDPASLEVCVVAGDGRCGPNLAPRADPAGIVSITFRDPITNPDVEVRARVRDLAGNETQVQHTIGWLIRNTVPGRQTATSAAPGVFRR